MRKVYEWSEVAKSERWGNSEVAQSERWEGSEVARQERWESIGGKVRDSFFNEGMISREAEIRGSMVKCGKRLLEVGERGDGGVCEIPVKLPMNDGAVETVEYM